MEKKKQVDVKSDKQGKEISQNDNNSDKRYRVSEYDKVFMQLLRSQRYSYNQIGKICNFHHDTVKKYTEDTRFPAGTDFTLSFIVRQLAVKTLLDAWIDKGENAREYALVVEKYLKALKDIEDLRIDITMRNKMLTLEDMMKEEYSQEVKEAMQQHYDQLNKELNG